MDETGETGGLAVIGLLEGTIHDEDHGPLGDGEELERILGDDADHGRSLGDDADPERILVVTMVGGDPQDAVITEDGPGNSDGSAGS